MNITRLRSTQGRFDAPVEMNWSAEVFDRLVSSDDGRQARPVLFRLGVSGPGAWGDVDAIAFAMPADLSAEQICDLLSGDLAAESSYDMMRSHLDGLFGTLGADVRVPISSPKIEISVLRDDEPEPPAAQPDRA
ncbi:hypothetical protein JVX92_00575 [Microbacterium hominis]|uniref:hypothetical protein n=1 Tax=Microbacterium hominis TaxID=162426 RepID=UPI001962783A|nr:hypothetical protein [Microbacterium hominis]QRY40823.1 hypothetical protein JVX92_00575 [Microbacterium hominis]